METNKIENEIKHIIIGYMINSITGFRKAITLSKEMKTIVYELMTNETNSVVKFYIDHLMEKINKNIHPLIDYDEHLEFTKYFNKYIFLWTGTELTDANNFAVNYIKKIVSKILDNQIFSYSFSVNNNKVILHFKVTEHENSCTKCFDIESFKYNKKHNIRIINYWKQDSRRFEYKSNCIQNIFKNVDSVLLCEINKCANFDDILYKLHSILFVRNEIENLLGNFASLCGKCEYY